MLAKKPIVGPIETNCDIAASKANSEAIIVDPGIRTKKGKTIITRYSREQTQT